MAQAGRELKRRSLPDVSEEEESLHDLDNVLVSPLVTGAFLRVDASNVSWDEEDVLLNLVSVDNLALVGPRESITGRDERQDRKINSKSRVDFT